MIRGAAGVDADGQAMALGGGVLFACGIGQALGFAPALAGRRFGGGRGGDGGFRRFDRLPLCLNINARGRKLAFDRLQPAAFGQAACGAGWRVRGDLPKRAGFHREV